MSSDESCRVQQINELEVLQSIFGDELRDLRSTKQRKKCHPLDLVITLTPQKGMSGPAEVYAQVDLHVTCSAEYPKELPKIQLKNSKGISHQQLAVYLSELENVALKRKGEVMIYDLCEHVKSFLSQHNKPGYSSFYEEMVLKQQEKIQIELQEKQLQADKERQVLQDEILKRQEALKAEIRNRRESTRLSLESDVIISQSIPSSPLERVRTHSRRRCMSTSESSEGSLCEHRGTKLILFDNNKGERQVYRGKCLGHSTKGSIVFAGLDFTTGELLAITEWTLKCGKPKNYDNSEASNLQHSMKQIASIEQELNYLCKLHHNNLVHYLNMKYLQDKDNNIIVYILQEFVIGTTCSYYLTESIPVDAQMLRHITIGILNALEHLHMNNVVHKDLRDSSVYIDKSGMIRLSDYSLDKRLSDIYRSNSIAKIEHDFPTIQGRGGKKADIYRLGILLLSLSKGSIVSQKEVEIDPSLHSDLRDFLSKCLDDNERNRWSAEQLLQHNFLRTPIERGISPPKAAGKQEKNQVEPEEEPDTELHFYLPSFGGQSRIQNEFEILKWLGKGAFGDVLKVKNKLDGGIYAIKRIELNPKEKQLNKKITREVKLLSRLNHENVVRYYNSWIESAKIDDDAIHSRLTPTATPSSKFRSNTEDKTFSVDDDSDSASVEKLAPPMREVEWNVSYESRTSAAMPGNGEQDNSDHSSDESDSDDEDWAFLMGAKTDSSSGGIVFTRDETSRTTTDSAQNSQDLAKTTVEHDDENATSKEIQFMYIQMEFCEKSTLRTAIDNGLHQDEERMWRLFREIVEGLAHIHQQGMIHRDLKPVNIFLDSNDHVKIGDFGLATTNVLCAFNQTHDVEAVANDKVQGSYDMDDVGSLTGQVGTALYAAPELSEQAAKAIYNQKVDIYSLGIIFFEMCYKPLSTSMERVKVLMSLRMKEIVIPEEMTSDSKNADKVKLLRWLLNHDPSLRPNSQELLSSTFLPPLQLEEAELQEMIRHTLLNVQSKAYKYLITSCFSQEITAAGDITYDMNVPMKGAPNFQMLSPFQENIKSKVIEIFKKHGGVCFTTPLFMPKFGPSYTQNDTCVRVMTRDGTIVSIPHDLRVPFARYAVRNSISNIRRYSIDRVYREKKTKGFHPCELYECAFDIISPVPNNLMSEAELIYIAWEICNEIPHLQERNFTVRINHTSLLRAVLMYCGIEPEKYQDIFSIICDARDGKFSRFQVQTHLISLCLTDSAMETLFNLFETENSVAKIKSVLTTITKRKGESAALAKQGLEEIEEVTAHLDALGIKWPITVVPLLVYNIKQHSGIIYQITWETKRRKKRSGQEVIAAGGRYDKMLSSFREVLQRTTNMAGKDVIQYGAGISISLDKLVCASSDDTRTIEQKRKFAIDVAVCCLDSEHRRKKELADVLHELWSLGLKVMSLDFTTSEEVLEYCRENGINQVVMLKSGEKGHLRIETWERDRYQARKVSICDLADQFQRQNDNVAPATLNRSESKISANSEVNVSSTLHNVNINFVLTDRDKLSGSGRRSYKNSITAQISSHVQRISPKVPIEVFAVFLELIVVRTITNFLEIDADEQTFQKSVQIVIDKHPRHKKYIEQICDEMWEARTDKPRPVLILYSLPDSGYMTLV